MLQRLISHYWPDCNSGTLLFIAISSSISLLLGGYGFNQVNISEQSTATIVSTTALPTHTPKPLPTQPPAAATNTLIQPTATPTQEPATVEAEEEPSDTPVAAAEPSPTPAKPTATFTPSPTQPPAPTNTPTAPAVVTTIPDLETLAIKLIPVASGFTKPVYLTPAGDGSNRLFLVEQAGRILILNNGSVNPTPFLDIVAIVGSDSLEQGLLSVAFHPDYANNGFFFVNYTNKQGHTVIARYQVSADAAIANPASAQILLTIEQPYANHNGGQVAFGPDNYLYIGMGDGGAAGDPHNNGQNLDTLLGKILRLDINADTYLVPQNNPFVSTNQGRTEIWSYGWRNPWRFSFDRATSDLYIADVGQNQYEEVHVELAGTSGGQNYGWRLVEGSHCFKASDCEPSALGVILPIAEYDHSLGCSITGGYVYRGSQFPALDGVYIYGDYCSGILWGLRRELDGRWSQAQLLSTGHTISSFGQDEAGELYLIEHKTGEIFQIGN